MGEDRRDAPASLEPDGCARRARKGRDWSEIVRKIGYAPLPTSTQNLERQIGVLRTERCDEISRESVSDWPECP